ncbi:uncharacterized protein LOC142661886 isoform X2 [Rhinoderma darwinii]|uniref:uncharacterized protein LOC142661886 isoform X2 n=1 Tax=Rhinoderma darwinii TaxID=43563 RepID=UPI003F678212
MSHQVPIVFHDVAASFTEEQWLRLENWQRNLYKNVIREIHEAITALGYAITNPDVLFNIKKQDESFIRIDCSSGERKEIPVGDHPNILIRIAAEDNEGQDEVYVEPLNSSPVMTTVVSLNAKKHQDLHDDVCSESQQNPLYHGLKQQRREPMRQEYLHEREYDDYCSPMSMRVKEEDEDDDGPYEEDELIDHYSSDSRIQDANKQQNDFLESHINKSILDHPNILIRIAAEDNEGQDEVYVEPLNSSPVMTTVVSLNAKKHQDLHDDVCSESQQNPLYHGLKQQRREPMRQEYLHEREYDDYCSPMSMRVKEEDEDDDGPYEEDELIDHYSSDSRIQDANKQQNDFLESHINKSILESAEIKQEEERIEEHAAQKDVTLHQDINCVIVKEEADEELAQREPTSSAEDKNVTCSTNIRQDNQAYKCVECGEWFIGMTPLIVHQRTHTSERPFSCDQCLKTYRFHSSLYKHKRTHKGKKQFVCEDCDKSFSHNGYLQRHQLTHTRMKTVACNLCDKKFYSQNGLHKHHLIKHITTGP